MTLRAACYASSRGAHLHHLDVGRRDVGAREPEPGRRSLHLAAVAALAKWGAECFRRGRIEIKRLQMATTLTITIAVQDDGSAHVHA